MLLLGHSSAVGALRSAWFIQLEAVLLLDGTPILTGVLLWSIAMLFFGGIPIVAGLLLWWITIRVDRQVPSINSYFYKGDAERADADRDKA